MPNAPFPIQADLTAIAVAYTNKALIADQVLPRVPVVKKEFKYRKYALADGFTVPDTKVGRTSVPNRVEFGFTEQPASVYDYGLEDPIPQDDLDNAPPNYNPLGRSTEMLTNLILLDREIRVASKVFDAANYGTANKQTLSGTSQFSDFTNSDPLGVILAALDSCVMRPNIMVMGRPVYSKLRQHPKVVKAVLGNAGDSGVVKAADIADLLELEAVLIGEAFVNTAKPGQTPSLARAWGKNISLIYRDSLADVRNGVTFGFTAQYGAWVAGAAPDRNIGLRGGQMVRVGESVAEVICANDLGYLVQNAVA